ncbi:DUF418 domain-containing protein [Qipengyuania nanhaisediminis]|uniref:DUF418 domain-containing protein n=1 Tax=Qipengyuania nanhaisediminis TaxID=604088 RepID=UPI0038B2A415
MTDTQAAGETHANATPDMAPAASAAPVAKGDRIESLDFIRGIAVMGILAANIVAFGQPFAAYMYPGAFLTEHGATSEWMLIGQYVLIDNKMRGLFTLLFGAGLYLFMERAWARGSTRWLQVWRLAILLVFGLVHFFFIWMGDILTYYALIGFLVVPLLKLAPRTQFGLALAGYMAGVLFYAGAVSMPYFIAETSFGDSAAFADSRAAMVAGMEDALADGETETALIRQGDLAGLAEHRLNIHGTDPLTNLALFIWETLPLMLLGVALYRMGFFSGAIAHAKMVRWGWIGLAFGAAIHLAIGLWLKSVGFSYYAMLAAYVAFSALPQLIMVLALAALMVAYSPGWTGWLAERVRAAGRAAFTNYLGTSVLMLFVMQGWGLALFGELNRPLLYLLTAAFWVLMLAWSKPWLDRYRYGPLEWLWRCLTYRTLFPLRRG